MRYSCPLKRNGSRQQSSPRKVNTPNRAGKRTWRDMKPPQVRHEPQPWFIPALDTLNRDGSCHKMHVLAHQVQPWSSRALDTRNRHGSHQQSPSRELSSGFSSEPAWLHESIHANRFKSQLLDHCPGNTPNFSTWLRKSALITTRIYNDIFLFALVDSCGSPCGLPPSMFWDHSTPGVRVKIFVY